MRYMIYITPSRPDPPPSCIQVMAHPSHGGRSKAELTEDFDREMPRYKRFQIDGNQVTWGPDQED